MAVQLPPIPDELRRRIKVDSARRAVREDAELTISRWEAMAAHEDTEEARQEWLTMVGRLRGLLAS